jgi:ferredoxin
MAETAHRLAENAPGPYYVTADCIDCDLCRETAPSVFRRHDGIGYSVAYRQPTSETERLQADKALRECPVEAIGAENLEMRDSTR